MGKIYTGENGLMKMRAKAGSVIGITTFVMCTIMLTLSAVMYVLSANQQAVNSSLTVNYVATNVYVEVDAKYQRKQDASPTALSGGPLTFNATDTSATGTLAAGNITLDPNNNYVLFTYSFKNKATAGAYDISVSLTDTVNKTNVKVYYATNAESTAMSTMATTMTTSQTTTAPQNITIPAQQTKYLYVYVEIDDWYFGASYTSDASHFLKFDISSTMVVNFESYYQAVEYIESTGEQSIDTGVVGTQDTNAEMDFCYRWVRSYDNNYLLACNYNDSGTPTRRVYLMGTKGDGNRYLYAYNDIAETTDFSIEVDKRYTLRTERRSGLQKTYLNDEEIHSANNTGDYTSTTLRIFSLGNQIDSNYCNANARVYYLRLYDGTTLVRNFIPCYRKSDHKPGLYDTVNGVFYTNQGSGEFVLPS